MKSREDHIESGFRIVMNGELKHLRQRLRFSRSAMADLLHVSQVTYNRCEDRSDLPDNWNKMWSQTAERIGRFVYLANLTLDELDHLDINFRELMPIHLCASRWGLPNELILHWIREDRLQVEDLGVLGIWIHRSELPHLLSRADDE